MAQDEALQKTTLFLGRMSRGSVLKSGFISSSSPDPGKPQVCLQPQWRGLGLSSWISHLCLPCPEGSVSGAGRENLRVDGLRELGFVFLGVFF